MTKTRLLWMDAVRGAMILLVILFHAAGRIRRYAPDELTYLWYFNSFWEPFRMPTLVLLSGMLLSRSLKKARGTYISGKVRQLLWPYVIWSVVFLVSLDATGGGTDSDPLWLQLMKIATGSATYLWFLAFLFVYYMLSIFISGRVREILIPVAAVAAVPMLWIDGAYEWRKFTLLLAFFWLGDMVSRRNLLQAPALRHPATIATCFALALATAIAGTLTSWPKYSPLTMVGVIAGIVCLIAIAQKLAGSRLESFLAGIGQNTIVYYTSHYIIMATAYFVIDRIIGFNQPDVLFFTLVACALAGGWFLTWLRQRFTVVRWLFVMPNWRKTARP